MNDQNTCPSCGGPYGEHASDCTALADALALIDELHQQDRLKTREINTLVPENLTLIAQRDELRAELLTLANAYNRLLLAYGKPFEWGEVNTDVAMELLAKTAPVNPNAGVVQAAPKGRW